MECKGLIKDKRHSITTLNKFMDDTRGKFLKADPVVLKERSWKRYKSTW